MAVGFPVKADYATGDVLSAANMNDLSGTLNTIQSVEYAAGKNKIINGDFGIWQRGTSFNFSSVSGYTADRWSVTWNGSGATRTISQQTFTPGTAPVAGYEGRFFYRYDQSVAGSGGTGNFFFQPIEDVRTFAGQTVTASFWAKADASRSVPVSLDQVFGGGGSGQVSTSLGTASITTAWTRFTFTAAIPSISGKTVGTSSYLQLLMTFPANTVQTIDIWGVQVEASSTASDFQTATGTLQGELAACQRYYMLGTMDVRIFSGATATQATAIPQKITPMRITPTATFTAAASATNNISGTPTITMSDGTTLKLSFIYSGTNADTYYVRAYELAAEL
jgi:hypothetical protein